MFNTDLGMFIIDLGMFNTDLGMFIIDLCMFLSIVVDFIVTRSHNGPITLWDFNEKRKIVKKLQTFPEAENMFCVCLRSV